MRKLFLTSNGLSALPGFLGMSPTEVKLVYITTASNTYDNPTWLDRDREALRNMGFEFTELDITGKTKDQLKEAFKDVNIIFVAGGNTFYLLEKVRESGFDEIIKSLVEKGVVYGGGSAGACLAGPDIEPIAVIDHPEKVSDLKSTKSLGLVDFVVVPHFDNEKYGERTKKIVEEYKDKFKLIPINDDQAILVEGENYKIVQSI